MSAAAIIEKVNFKRRLWPQIAAWLIFPCILFNALPLLGRQSSKSSELVFCPLQKTWVEKYSPPVKIFREPLGEICASNRKKSQFSSEIVKKAPLLRFIPNSQTIEKLFFKYLEKGKQAFGEISPSQNSPESEPAKFGGEQKNAGSVYKTNFDQSPAETFTLPQAARPPTILTLVSYQTIDFGNLEKISRRIRPRAPPTRS